MSAAPRWSGGNGGAAARARQQPARCDEPLAAHDRYEIGGQLLRVCAELDRLVWRGVPVGAALEKLQAHPSEFHPDIVAALGTALSAATPVKSSF
jgi:hypothetical protein